MKKCLNITWLLTLTVLFSLSPLTAPAQTSASYLYHLADFNGPVASQWARIAVDRQQGEVYTLNRTDSAIQIFSDTAMQTFGFGENLALTSAVDITSGDNGEIFVLYRFPVATVKRLNYRGEPIGEIKANELAKELASFTPDFLDYQQGHLFLADAETMQVIAITPAGELLQRYDFRREIAEMIKANESGKPRNQAQLKKVQDDLATLKGANLSGFSVDGEGTIYFTIAPLFSAFRATPQTKLEGFGVPGGAPGKFGVVASIEADRQGNIFVSDRLRCVVLMFDHNLDFQMEFGYRGTEPQNLVVPDDLAIDTRNHKIYVAQAANRGVSVFTIETD